MFIVCFIVVFNFVLFSVLGADEVFTGQRYADAVCGRPKVCDDGAACHQGEGKAIVNSCTDGSKKLPLREQLHKDRASIVGNNNTFTLFM